MLQYGIMSKTKEINVFLKSMSLRNNIGSGRRSVFNSNKICWLYDTPFYKISNKKISTLMTRDVDQNVHGSNNTK